MGVREKSRDSKSISKRGAVILIRCSHLLKAKILAPATAATLAAALASSPAFAIGGFDTPDGRTHGVNDPGPARDPSLTRPGHSGAPYGAGRYNGYGPYGAYGWGYPGHGYVRYREDPEDTDFDFGYGHGCAIERQQVEASNGWRWTNARHCY
jgi:hypothetical protein